MGAPDTPGAGEGDAPGERKRKARSAAERARRDRGANAGELPAADFDAPLHELTFDELSVFLYVALQPDETTALIRELGLRQPGFRQESLGDVQRCDLIAGEILDAPDRRAPVLDRLRKALTRPILSSWPLDPAAAADLVEGTCLTGAPEALALWRVLADPSPAVRAEVKPALAELQQAYYKPGDKRGVRSGPGGDEEAPDPGPDPEGARLELARKLEDAERRLTQSEAKAEAARRKGEEAREKLQAWLKSARAREAQAVEDAARAREETAAARRELAQALGDLAAAKAQDAAMEAQRLRAALRDEEARANGLAAKLERSRTREEELEGELARAREAAAAHAAPAPARAGTEPGEAEPEDAQAFLLPVYTREFYDSIEGWDRRVQRAAFKQAALLAMDHRHPSLRALPLEGLPGYYRVRVATDVRLLYRRTERQNTIEILSLIDREDLDRYIKQAKTR